jgi:hypothetical protein
MTYLNQPWFNRKIINTFAMATGAVHSETLTVIGRASKQPQKIPVTPVDVDGVKYLVSTRGEVKNVRNDPNVTLITTSGTTKYLAQETPVENRRPIIDAYTLKAGKIVKGYFSKLPDPADHAVFIRTAIILAFHVIRHTDDRHDHVNTSRLRGLTRPSTGACPIQRLAR